MNEFTKKQRIVLWLIHQGKKLRRGNFRVFFEDKPHITINDLTVTKLFNTGVIEAESQAPEHALLLTSKGRDYVVNKMRPFKTDVSYGGTWTRRPIDGCDYCGRTTGRKSIKRFDCSKCDEVHLACPPCRNKHIRVIGEFPKYQIRMKACPEKKVPEASPEQLSVTIGPQA